MNLPNSVALIDIEESKKIELDILSYFARFCEEHGLRYFLAYGTLIGAVRHKGFIPWDDDVDVQMPREDYNRLIEIFNDQKEIEHLTLVSPEDKISRHSMVKIIDTRTVKIEKSVDYKNGYLGIDIDVFPLDGQPVDKDAYEKWYNKLHKIYWFYLINIMDPAVSIKRRVAIPLIRVLFNKKRLKKKADKLHAAYPYEISQYVGVIETPFDYKTDRVDKKHYEDFAMLEFEGQLFRAPVGYHEVLSTVYGDYMKLPPEEEQVTHHSNHSYWVLEAQSKKD